jgi:hypothetical protein
VFFLHHLADSTVVRNFGAMPKILRWITTLGLASVLMIFGTLVPCATVRAFGRVVLAEEWWSSGAGWIVLLSMWPLPVSAALMLLRRQEGAWLCVLGWITTHAGAPLVARMFGLPLRFPLQSLAFDLPIFVFLVLYLGRSVAVRAFFQGRADG